MTSPGPGATATPVQQPDDKTSFCPRCGSFFAAQVRFCTHDGVALDQIDRGTAGSGDPGQADADAADVLTGRTLADKYILKRRLGAGGMGAVYLAVQKPMGREVAVKVIYPHLLGEPKMVERALREAEAANQVDHPNVVTVYDSGRTREGLVYLAMEYLRGEDLAALLRRSGPLPPANALRLWLPAVRAMASAHRKGVVHRDLKPDNLFISRRPGADPEAGQTEIVKIVDFGIAKLRGSSGTKTEGVVGTLLYMSPEQLQGQEIGPQSDVYALGLILVQMLTGQLPWPGAGKQSVAGRVGPAAQGPPKEAAPAPDRTVVEPPPDHGDQGGPLRSAASPVRGSAATSLARPQGTDEPPQESPVNALQRLVLPPLPLRQLRPEVHFSAELQDLLDSVLSPQQEQRPADAGELLRLVIRLPEVQAHRDEIAPELRDWTTEPSVLMRAPVCPFPGLESFDEQQTRFFCGRDEEVRQALLRLGLTPEGRRRWLQIEGASGSGKSSLARAGLVPAVRHGQINGTRPFFAVAVFRPGRKPVRNLARALAEVLGGPVVSAGLGPLSAAQIESRLEAGDDALLSLLLERVPAGHDFLLLCDQLEEALVQDADGLRRFDGLLWTALLAEGSPLYLLTTIRSDLLARLHLLPQMEAALNDAARYYLRPMDDEGLRQALLEPARLSGLFFEPGLPDAIIAEARDAEGCLPLLAHVLRALWEQRTGRLLTRESYDSLGGVAGALTRSADGLLQSLADRGGAQTGRVGSISFAGRGVPGEAEPARVGTRSLAGRVAPGEAEPLLIDRARRLFLRLVKIGRGTPDTRQAIGRAEALKLLGGDDEAERLLLRLSGAKAPRSDAPPTPRLLSVFGDGGGAEPKVDLVHESLLHRWQTLRDWIAQDRKMLERRDDLEATAQVWEATGHRADGLPQGGLLAYYEGAGLEEHQGYSLLAMASPRALRFLREGRDLEQAKDRDRRRRVQRGLALLTGVVLVLGALSGFALVERQRARTGRKQAEERLEDALLTANSVIQAIDRDLRPMAGTSHVRRDLLQAVAALQDRLLQGAKDNPRVLHSRILSHQMRGELALTHDNTAEALAESQAAVKLARLLVDWDPRSPQAQLDLMLSYRQLGDVTYDSGHVPETKDAFDKSLELTQRLAQAEPDNPELQLELGRSLERMGNLAAREGHLKEAAATYQRGRDIIQAACALGQHQPAYHFALAGVDERLGDTLTKAGQFQQAREALDSGQGLAAGLAAHEPHNEDYRRLLGTILTRLGALSLEAGHLQEAREDYRQSKDSYEKMLEEEPRSIVYRQRLASIRRAMGDIEQRMGDLGAAQASYEEALRLRQELLQMDRKNAAYRQGISTAYSALGELAGRRGQAEAALRYHQQALELRRELVRADPQSAFNRQRLAAGYEAIGAAQLQGGDLAAARASYEEALRLRKDLLKADVQSARYRQELGTAYSGLGALYSRLGERDAAQRAHDEALVLLRALVEQFPKSTLYRQDLASVYRRLAETALAAGDRQRAERGWAEVLRLRQELAQADPENAEWQRELAWAHLDLARLLGKGPRRKHLEAARGIVRQLVQARLLLGDGRLQQAQRELEALRRH